MGKGRFVNQKMGKRQSHRKTLLKAVLSSGHQALQPSPKKFLSIDGKALRDPKT